MLFEKKKDLAIVLSGGSAKGLAHIGVLEVLEENHIPIEAIVGTSMGALIGGLYASGKMKEFKKEAIEFSKNKIMKFLMKRKFGKKHLSVSSVKPFLYKFFKDKKIESLPISFTAVATDLKTGKEVFIDKGDLLTAVMASISIPGIFDPVRIDQSVLIDGGVVDPLPEKYGHVIADKVLTVNAMASEFKYKDEGEVFDVISEAVGIMSHEIIKLKSIKDDKTLLIQLDTSHIEPFDFTNIESHIEVGRKAALKNLKKIIELSKI